ncbi:hypothetical protein [Candidatus Enterococcus leclercqii]|uniref:hypothetical protein n=1 Tax=Candidatus Enterococcus leclercqii TaxID=1857218 RepID=UPI00137B8AA1|nr:hypothetical protein [Enterococcus sp. CU9D]KAF1294164.1 hypothetical protein BAU14_07185 [Enterococcus sp. CU9D]
MSLVYNNDKPAGICNSFAVENVQETSDFIKINDFIFFANDLSENQNMILNWLLEETKDVQECSFQPTGLIIELATGKSWVPPRLASLWRCTEEHQRQQIVLRFLAIKNGFTVR